MREAKRREEYLLSRDYELESSRVRYDADAEQRRASARDMYRANLESNRASKRWQQEKNSVAVRASKKRRYKLNSDEKRASKRGSLFIYFLNIVYNPIHERIYLFPPVWCFISTTPIPMGTINH